MSEELNIIPLPVKYSESDIKDGDVVVFNGDDYIKADKQLIHIGSLLMWPGLYNVLSSLPQVEQPVIHTFSGGVYIRELHKPKGVFSIGKRHRYEGCNILMKGTLSLYLGKGKPVEKLTGPTIITVEPMTSKRTYSHDDVIFMNLHPTKETDIGKIEEEFIVSNEEYLKVVKGGNLCLG